MPPLLCSPQAQKKRFGNRAAYILLQRPDFARPQVHHFDAVLPRPPVTAYYDYVNGLDSDEDLGLEGSEGSDYSSSGSDRL